MGTTPPLPSMIANFNTALGGVPSNVTAATAGPDLFEAYVFSLILNAAGAQGATSTFENRDGTIPGTAVFRTSPGHLYSTVQNYTHAVITFAGAPTLEAHIGVYISGKSTLIHEADIAVLLRTEGVISRTNSVPPRSLACVLTVECKFYSSNLGLALARGFVGLCSDLSSRDTFFVSNSGAVSVEKLLTHKSLPWSSQLRPAIPVEVQRFRNAIQTVFKRYQAKYA